METTVPNETLVNLFNELSIDIGYTSKSLDRMVEANSRYIKDMKLNVSSMLGSNNLTRKEAYLLALAVAINERHDVLITAFEGLAKKEGSSIEEIAETHACTSLMSINNIFYRFRHFMDKVEYYNKHPAGLRMSLMMNPAMGKGLFELMSLVLSAVNGCERCVVSHEHSLKALGADEPRIYDAVRLGAVIKGLCIAM